MQVSRKARLTGTMLAAFVATAGLGSRSEALTQIRAPDDPDCILWANDDGQPLIRASGKGVLLQAPCGHSGSAAVQYTTSAPDNQTIVMVDTTKGNVETFKFDGGTGLVKDSLRPIGASDTPRRRKRGSSRRAGTQ